MTTVLITGIHGFTGVFLARQLRSMGYSVYGLTHNEGPLKKGVYSCNLMDTQGVADVLAEVKPDHVVHLAGIAFVAHGDANEMYSTNVVGTRNLLEAVATCGKTPLSILLASSANVYGNSQIDPLVETVEPAPTNDYAVSKVAMEYMARLWVAKLPITFVRPFNYTGVGQSNNFLLPKIVDHFKRGAEEIELGNLEIRRDFSDVRSVVSSYIRLLDIAPSGDVFNVCSGQVHSMKDVLKIMEGIAGYKIKVIVNPKLVREGELQILRGSNQKLIEKIGSMNAIPLAETLRWMYES